MESKLFNCVLSSPQHVLYQLQLPVKHAGCNLRQRSYHRSLRYRQLTIDNSIIRKNFYVALCVCMHWIVLYICLYVCVLHFSAILYASCCYGLRLSFLN